MVLVFMLVILKSWGGWDGILSSLVSIASDYIYYNDFNNIFMVNIINLTDLELTLIKAGVETIIPPYHIEWYSIAKGSRVEVQANASVTFVECDVTDHVDIKVSKIGGVVMMNFGEFDNSEIITYLIMK